MGMLAIRVMAGGPLASPRRPERLAMMTADTDLDNEVRCAAAVRAALGASHGTPAQMALRFALGNRDLSTRVVGVTDLAQLDEALAAVERGPLAARGHRQARPAVGDRFLHKRIEPLGPVAEPGRHSAAARAGLPCTVTR